MKKLRSVFLLGLVILSGGVQALMSQEISIHIYRRVAPGDMQDYLNRETTYWQKYAQSEIDKGNMTFWAVLQRVGGENMEKEPNILLINNYADVDKGVDWSGITKQFPNAKMEDMETGSLSTNTDLIYIRDLGNHIQVEESEFNPGYIRIIYHDVADVNAHLAFEADKWKPMVQKAMADGKTTLLGWGNGMIVSPESEHFPYDTYSYDLFGSLQDALSPEFSDDLDVPDDFFAGLEGNYNGPRYEHIYRIVAVAFPGME